MKNTSFLKSCLELSALLATACGRFLFKDVLVLKLIYMLTATLVWFCYFLYTYRTDKKRFKSWGISFQNFNSTFKELFPFLLFFILLFVLLGYGLNITTLSWRILPALLIYPFWGMLQQIMIIGLFTFLLKQFFPTISNTLIILLTAVTFSLVHYPSTILMPGTLVMALVYTYLYLSIPAWPQPAGTRHFSRLVRCLLFLLFVSMELIHGWFCKILKDEKHNGCKSVVTLFH